MYSGTFFSFQYFDRSSRLGGELAAFHDIVTLKYRDLITQEEIERIKPTYKFNMIAGLSKVIRTRAEVEYILDADEATLERLEKNLKLIFTYNVLSTFGITIPQLMSRSDELLQKFGENVNSVFKLKALLNDGSLDSILARFTPEFLRFYEQYSDLVKSKEDLKTLSALTPAEAQRVTSSELMGVYELNLADVVNMAPEFVEKLQACRQFFYYNPYIHSDDHETRLTKDDILSLSLQQLDNIAWFENNIVQYNSWNPFPQPEPVTHYIKQFYTVANLDNDQKSKLSLARKADVVAYYGIEKIISFTVEQLQTVSDKIEPYFDHLFSKQVLYQKIGDTLKVEPHLLQPIEKSARQLRKSERNSLQIDHEGRKELEEMIHSVLLLKKLPDADLANFDSTNVPLRELVRYPNSVKAYLAYGSIEGQKDSKFKENFLRLIKFAVQGHYSEILKTLLDYPVENDRFYQAELNESLCLAAEKGFQDCVEILVDHGANLNYSSASSFSSHKDMNAFHIAIWEGHEPTAQYLWDKFHNISMIYESNQTPMHVAARRGQHGILKKMIEDGVEVDPRAYKKATPLHMAIESIRTGVSREDVLQTIDVLLNAGANPNAIVDLRTAYAATNHLSGEFQTQVQELINSKSKYKVKGEWGDLGNVIDDHSDFFNAAYHGDMERFRKYLKFYQVNRCSHTGESALHFAVKNSQYDMAEFLLEQDISPTQEERNKIALELAKDKNDMQMVNIITSYIKPRYLPETGKAPGVTFFEPARFLTETNEVSDDESEEINGEFKYV